MDARNQVSQAQEFFRAREEERKEITLFRAVVRSAVTAVAAKALFGRRGS